MNEIWKMIHGTAEYGIDHESEHTLVIRAENWGDEDAAIPVFVISVEDSDGLSPACVIDATDGCPEAPGWINDGGYPLKGEKPVWAPAAEKLARLLHEKAPSPVVCGICGNDITPSNVDDHSECRGEPAKAPPRVVCQKCGDAITPSEVESFQKSNNAEGQTPRYHEDCVTPRRNLRRRNNPWSA